MMMDVLSGMIIGGTFIIILTLVSKIIIDIWYTHKTNKEDEYSSYKMWMDESKSQHTQKMECKKELEIANERVRAYSELLRGYMMHEPVDLSQPGVVEIYNSILEDNLASRLKQAQTENTGLRKRNKNYKKLIKDLQENHKKLKKQNRKKANEIKNLQQSLNNHKHQVQDLKLKRDKLKENNYKLVCENIALTTKNKEKEAAPKLPYYDEIKEAVKQLQVDGKEK